MAFVPAQATARLSVSDTARTYVEARAAAMSGEHVRAAQLLASLAEAQPGQVDIARKAVTEAIGAGQMALALNLARALPAAKLPGDARLLLVGEEIRRGHPERALPWLAASGNSGDLSFFSPLITAWAAADRGHVDQAIATFDQLPKGSLLTPMVAEERAFLLLKARRSAEAEPLARQVVGHAGGREQRLRLAFADAFLGAGDRQRALMIIEGMGEGEAAARQRIMAGKTSGLAVDSLQKAYAEVLVAFAADLMRIRRPRPPVGLVQIARYVNPQNSGTTALLALLLSRPGPRRRGPRAASERAVRRSIDRAGPRRADADPDREQEARRGVSSRGDRCRGARR